MLREKITAVPYPNEPYLLFQVIRFGKFLFISRQAGYTDEGKVVEWGRAQGNQAFSNLARTLKAGGYDLNTFLTVTMFLPDMGNFREIVEIRQKHFSKPYPADSIVQVSSLYTAEGMIEIEAIAAVDSGGK